MEDAELCAIAARLQAGEPGAIDEWDQCVMGYIDSLEFFSDDQRQEAYLRMLEVRHEIWLSDEFPWDKGPRSYMKDAIYWATFRQCLKDKTNGTDSTIDAARYLKRTGGIVPKPQRLFDKHGRENPGIETFDTWDRIHAACADDLDRDIVELFDNDRNLSTKEGAEELGVSPRDVSARRKSLFEKVKAPQMTPRDDVSDLCELPHEREIMAVLSKYLNRNSAHPISDAAAELGVHPLIVAALRRRVELGRLGAARITSTAPVQERRWRASEPMMATAA